MVSSYGILLVPIHKLWEGGGGTEKVRYEKLLAYRLLECFCCIDECNVGVRVGWVFPYCLLTGFKYLLHLS